jgi:AbrB family looped-hinge helix DNA binding protein
MRNVLTIDKAGRIVLPKPIRDELELRPGDALEIECKGEHLTLRPVRGNVQMRKEQGVWVFYSGEPLSPETVEKTRQQIYLEREHRFLGRRK